MKKGSMVVRCATCGRQVGWLIPTGMNRKTGRATFNEKLEEGVVTRHTAWCDYYVCRSCTEG